MSDQCRRPICGHAWAAHDRRGHRLACDVCPCHAYVADYRGTALALAVLLALAVFVAALALISGAS